MNDTKTPEVQAPPPLPDVEERKRRMASDGPVKHADEKFCSNCGAIIKIKSLSCPKCGKKQRKEGMGCLPMAAIGVAICFAGFFILGILAAIAIPQFTAYRMRSYEASLKTELNKICTAEEDYFTQNDKYTDSLEELGYIARPDILIQVVESDDECFYAEGEMKNLKKRFSVDCNCEITSEEINNE